MLVRKYFPLIQTNELFQFSQFLQAISLIPILLTQRVKGHQYCWDFLYTERCNLCVHKGENKKVENNKRINKKKIKNINKNNNK